MSGRKFGRLALLGLITLIMASMGFAMAASNTVPVTHLDQLQFAITANDLKPAQCAGINVTNLVTGSGTFTGTAGNDLILGSAGADTIYGDSNLLWGTGNDCIVGGGGNDEIHGDGILFGGSGNDVCIGGPGTDTFYSCETQIQ